MTAAAYKFQSMPSVKTDFPRPDPAQVKAAAAFGTATLHEAGGKIGALPSAIKPAVAGFSLCGPAFTIHGLPGDNLWLHRAIAIAAPGDVLVAYVDEAFEFGYWGEIMSTAAHARKLGGLVLDACVRDGAVLANVGFPVFSRGLCIRGTGKNFDGIGRINQPLIFGDVTVNAGDLIVGDVDGVVAIPREDVARIVTASAEREAKEAAVMQRLRDGEISLEIYGWDR